MKRTIVLILLLMSALAFAQQIDGYVNDYANVLDAPSKAELNSLLKSLKDQGIAEFAIVTINSLDGKDIQGYAYELANGVLGDKQKNNGLLLLVAIEDRKYRFEVGRGLEPELPDIIAGRIARQYIVPNFKSGNYSLGILEASKAINARLTKDADNSYYVANNVTPSFQNKIKLGYYGLLLIAILVMFVIAVIKRKKQRPNDSTYFIAAWALSQMMRNSGRGRGGFGGFGGGSFGGGGAGGGW